MTVGKDEFARAFGAALQRHGYPRWDMPCRCKADSVGIWANGSSSPICSAHASPEEVFVVDIDKAWTMRVDDIHGEYLVWLAVVGVMHS